MLEQREIDEYSRILKACEEANKEAQQINTEIAMLKKILMLIYNMNKNLVCRGGGWSEK